MLPSARLVGTLIGLLVSLLVAQARAQNYPDPGACTGQCKFLQDMSVIISDNGTYYRFAGHYGIQIATAPALTGPWKNSSSPAFPVWRSSLAYLKESLKDLWAPDVRKIGDTYYLFFAAENFGTGLYGAGNEPSAHYGETVVATSKSLDGGTWEVQNILDIPIHGPQYTRFDSSLLVEGDDIYLSFGSYSWGMFGMSMQSPPVQVLNQTVTELVADVQVPPAPLNSAVNKSESSYLFKNNGFYYLFYASGDCCAGNVLAPGAEYKIMYCRAQAVTGPYYARDGSSCLRSTHGTVLLASHGKSVYAPGAPCILDDPTLGLVMIYQYMNPRVGYGEINLLMGWNPLSFPGDWPVLGEASIPQTTLPGNNPPDTSTASSHRLLLQSTQSLFHILLVLAVTGWIL